MIEINKNIFTKHFSSDKNGEGRKVIFENGTSISTKRLKSNKFIVRYKPENYKDYLSPYFLFELEKDEVRKIIPFPNIRSFIYALLIIFGFLYFKKIQSDQYFNFIFFTIIFICALQIVVGIISYLIIKRRISEKNEFRNKN